MELEILKEVGSMGVGAILGSLIFLMYRRDRLTTEKRINDIHEANSDRLTMLLTKDQESREKNTEALTALSGAIRGMATRYRATDSPL